MQNWSPESWNNLGVVGLVVIMGAIFYWSIVTERLVPGYYYRRSEARADKLVEANDTLAKALAESTDNNAATVNVLESLRHSLDRR
jgi:hypothetical protein